MVRPRENKSEWSTAKRRWKRLLRVGFTPERVGNNQKGTNQWTSAITNHGVHAQLNHILDWESAKIVTWEGDTFKRGVKEAIIRQIPRNINRDGDITSFHTSTMKSWPTKLAPDTKHPSRLRRWGGGAGARGSSTSCGYESPTIATAFSRR